MIFSFSLSLSLPWPAVLHVIFQHITFLVINTSRWNTAMTLLTSITHETQTLMQKPEIPWKDLEMQHNHRLLSFSVTKACNGRLNKESSEWLSLIMPYHTIVLHWKTWVTAILLFFWCSSWRERQWCGVVAVRWGGWRGEGGGWMIGW